MTFDSRDNRDTFWNLAMLMTDFSVEIMPCEVDRFAPLTSIVPAGTRVGLATRPGFPSPRTNAAARTLIWSGMRPVLPLDLRDAADRRHADRVVATWEHLGVDDIVLNVGVARDFAGALDTVAEFLGGPVVRHRGFRSVGVRLGRSRHRQVGTLPTDSVHLLRALDTAERTALDLGIELYLTPPHTANVHRLMRWERSLRGAGNRLPIRVGLPGLPDSDRLPWSRPARSREDPRRMVLGLAATLTRDPDSRVRSVHLLPAGTLAQSARWALGLGEGNFVIEEDPDQGHRVTLLG